MSSNKGIKVEIVPGVQVCVAAKLLMSSAKTNNSSVYTLFNGILMDALPGEAEVVIIDRYYSRYDLAHDEHSKPQDTRPESIEALRRELFAMSRRITLLEIKLKSPRRRK